jgi:SPX domain protein involved in polyphosphate accumulation
MLLKTEQSESLRYERKYLITAYSHKEVEQLIKLNNACFSEVYHQRNVNNIYFDTLGMDNFYDNVEGTSNRMKVRIRWYGDTFGNSTQPVLEYKIKKGLLGKKISYLLNTFLLDQSFDRTQILKATNGNAVPRQVQEELLSLKPMLLNSYTRKYFLSADKKFRITIDHHLCYYGIRQRSNTFSNKSMDHNTTVLELKYDSSHETEAKELSTQFPFALTKSSKYLQGLERIFI